MSVPVACATPAISTVFVCQMGVHTRFGAAPAQLFFPARSNALTPASDTVRTLPSAIAGGGGDRTLTGPTSAVHCVRPSATAKLCSCPGYPLLVTRTVPPYTTGSDTGAPAPLTCADQASVIAPTLPSVTAFGSSPSRLLL